VRRAAVSSGAASTFAAAQWILAVRVFQDDNVSFTMSDDKSLASFLQTRSALILAYTFAA
jgi:hypothetical protein